MDDDDKVLRIGGFDIPIFQDDPVRDFHDRQELLNGGKPLEPLNLKFCSECNQPVNYTPEKNARAAMKSGQASFVQVNEPISLARMLSAHRNIGTALQMSVQDMWEFEVGRDDVAVAFAALDAFMRGGSLTVETGKDGG